VAGALTERAFVESLERTGLTGVSVLERTPYGLDDLVHEPTFPPDLIALMRRILPARVQRRVGLRVVITARAPAARAPLQRTPRSPR
jgi:hypothetical protein